MQEINIHDNMKMTFNEWMGFVNKYHKYIRAINSVEFIEGFKKILNKR